MSCVNSARLSPLPPMCHTFTAQQERRRWCPVQAARPSSTPSAHAQLFTACHTPGDAVLPSRGGYSGFGMTPWCFVRVCSWRRLLADRDSLPFPWTLSLHRRWCPSTSHHPWTFLFLLALTVPLPVPFPSLGLSLRMPWCPSAFQHSFPFHSLRRLCRRSPRTSPVSLLRIQSTRRKANAFAVGQVRPNGYPKPAVR